MTRHHGRQSAPGAQLPPVEEQYFTDAFAGYLYLDPSAGLSVVAAATSLMQIRMQGRPFKIVRVPRQMLSRLKDQRRSMRAGAYKQAREYAEIQTN